MATGPAFDMIVTCGRMAWRLRSPAVAIRVAKRWAKDRGMPATVVALKWRHCVTLGYAAANTGRWVPNRRPAAIGGK